MPVLRNIGVLATCPAHGAGDAGEIAGAALAWRGGEITWVGPQAQLPERWRSEPAHDARGALVVPGLVDCHTHLAFAGWRVDEFTARRAGQGVVEIAAAGGGIARTAAQTCAASEDALVERAQGFLAAMRALGVTTVEAKSGYGLDVENELKLLRVYRRLAAAQPVRIVPTLLAAHALPAVFAQRRGQYLAQVCEQLLPAAAEWAEFCDVFVERGAFTADEGRRVLRTAARYGLKAKVHADQLADGGGAQLAADCHAVSADHLEYASEAGIAALAEAGVVAVSLPLAGLVLNQPAFPARRFLDAGVAVAVATDFNPGSAPSFHLPLALWLACTRQGMTPAEALRGATCVAARAVGRQATLGSLTPGRAADFVLIDAPDVDHWLVHFQANACRATVIDGQFV